jgi:hypothetical protein
MEKAVAAMNIIVFILPWFCFSVFSVSQAGQLT